MKKVLVTGATGFIGRCCLQPLEALGYEVHAVTSRRPPSNPGSVHWHASDLMNFEQTRGLVQAVRPTHLAHFAWFTLPKEYWTSVENVRWVQASLALLQAFVENGGQRAVMAGTCAEYDWTYGYCSESVTPLAPSSLYGICKQALQTMLAAYARQAGVGAAWGRVFFVYGPGEHPDRLVPSVIRSLLRRERARCSHGRQIRDFLYAQDAAEAFAALLSSEVSGAVNIASGQPLALKDLIHKIGSLMQQLDLIQLDALAPAPGDPPLLVADTRRICNQVGWQPRVSLEQGLARTIRWWAAGSAEEANGSAA